MSANAPPDGLNALRTAAHRAGLRVLSCAKFTAWQGTEPAVRGHVFVMSGHGERLAGPLAVEAARAAVDVLARLATLTVADDGIDARCAALAAIAEQHRQRQETAISMLRAELPTRPAEGDRPGASIIESGGAAVCTFSAAPPDQTNRGRP